MYTINKLASLRSSVLRARLFGIQIHNIELILCDRWFASLSNNNKRIESNDQTPSSHIYCVLCKLHYYFQCVHKIKSISNQYLNRFSHSDYSAALHWFPISLLISRQKNLLLWISNYKSISRTQKNYSHTLNRSI